MSIPSKAIVWLLLGAAAILIAGRRAPNLLRRFVAASAAIASLVALWPLTTGSFGTVAISWVPLNLFRMSPSFSADKLAWLVAITLVGATAAILLGVRGIESPNGAWHGLLLVALAGCLAMTLSGNLISLALGSGLLDLAILSLGFTTLSAASRVTWRIGVVGIASTALIVLGALQMNTQIGTAALSALRMPAQVVDLLAVAGALRLLVFPLHPRGLRTPENASLSLLSGGIGIYLLSRAQTIAPANKAPYLLLAGGISLLVGGFLAWVGTIEPNAKRHPVNDLGAVSSRQKSAFSIPKRNRGLSDSWPGLALHHAGYGLVFVLMAHGGTPWPIFSLLLALGILVIWWDRAQALSVPARTKHAGPSQRQKSSSRASARPSWLRQRARALESRVRDVAALAKRSIEQLQESWPDERWTLLFPFLALACLAGVPLTVGAIGRWQFYVRLLHSQNGALLLAALLGDSLLVAALWLVAGAITRTGTRSMPARPGLAVEYPPSDPSSLDLPEPDRSPAPGILPSSPEHAALPEAELSAAGEPPEAVTSRGQSGFTAVLAMAAMTVPLILLSMRAGSLSLPQDDPPQVAPLAVAFVFLLPWILGTVLARVGSRVMATSGAVGSSSLSSSQVTCAATQRVGFRAQKAKTALVSIASALQLEWFYRAVDMVVRRLSAAIHWLGQVGEGEGWFGWALIVLALGAIFLSAR